MAHKACIPCAGEGLSDGRIIELLIRPQLVSAGDSSGMKVGKVFDVFPDGRNHISFHHLHMIDIVEKLESWVPNLAAELYSPACVIALVIGVINPGVQEFHNENNIVLFRKGENSLQSEGAVIQSLLI